MDKVKVLVYTIVKKCGIILWSKESRNYIYFEVVLKLRILQL